MSADGYVKYLKLYTKAVYDMETDRPHIYVENTYGYGNSV